MPGPVTPVPRRPDDDAPLRLVLGALLGLHDQAPAVWRFVRWVRRLAGLYLLLHAQYTGIVLLDIHEGECVKVTRYRWDGATDDAA